MEYKVRFVNYPAHYHSIESEIDAAIKEILLNGDFILRSQLEEFEKNIAPFLGVKHAIGVNSGTDALYLSAIAAGMGPGMEVITVAHTFVARNTIKHISYLPDAVKSLVILYRAFSRVRILTQQKIQKFVS